MKFIKEPVRNGVVIPNAALRLSELDGVPLELHTLTNAAVVISGEMDAMELIRTADSLNDVASKLLLQLARDCGHCDCCGDPGEACELLRDPETPDILVPAWALEEADIPRDAKLTCEVNEDSGEIYVRQADYDFDLTDVPLPILDFLRSCGVCLEALEDRLMDERIVYGE